MPESQKACFNTWAAAASLWLVASMVVLVATIIWAGWTTRKNGTAVRTGDRLLIALLGLVGCGVMLAGGILRVRSLSMSREGTSLVVLLLAAVCAAWALFFRRPEPRSVRWVYGALLSFLAALACLEARVVVGVYSLVSANRTDFAHRAGTLTDVGQPAPDFTVSTLGGETVQLADLRGRVVLLNFFATWCGPCQLELPRLQTIWNEYRSRDDFRLIVVGREETADAVAQFQKDNGFDLPMAPDPDRAIYEKFATQYIPRTYLISREGKILFQTTGFYDEELDRLKALLAAELARHP